MADGYWRRDSDGNYHWTTYGSGIGIVIVILVILAIVVQCSDTPSKSVDSTSSDYSNSYSNTGKNYDNSTNNSTLESSRKKLADLHVFSDHSDLINNIHTGKVEDSYGNIYEGPYLELCSYGDYGGVDYDVQAFTELVVGGNYRYLSGTFFTRTRQSDDYTIEFLIYADDKLIYSSGEIDRKTKAINFSVDIGNCELIRIQSRSTDYTLMDTNPGIILVNAEVYN